MATVVITGAGGFLGRAVARRLSAQGHIVRAITRQGEAVAGANESLASGDLRAADPTPLVAGCDAVVNCAARVHILSPQQSRAEEAEFLRMNAEFPVRLAEAALSQGASHFVQISSAAAIASQTGLNEVVTDATPPRPSTPYGRSKLAGDLALLDRASAAFAVTCLRPPAIFGPGAAALFGHFFRAARLGVPLPLRSIRNQRSFAFSENIADAISATLRRPQSGAYLVTDSAPLSSAELYDRLAALEGFTRRSFSLRPTLVRALAKAALGKRAESLLGNAAFDGARFRREFEWSPPFSLDAALDQMAGETGR